MLEKRLINLIRICVYLMLAIVPLIFYPKMMYPFQTPKTLVFQALVEIIFAAWVVLALISASYRPKLSPVSIGLLIFLAVVTIASIFGVNPRMSFWSEEGRMDGLFFLAHVAALFFALSSLSRQLNWRHIWLFQVLVSGLVSLSALIGLWFPSFLYLTQAPYRPGGTLNNPAYLAGYLLFGFFLGLWLIGLSYKKGTNNLVKNPEFIAAAIGTALALAGIFVSQTLATIFGLYIGVLFLLIHFGYKNRRAPINKFLFLVIAALVLMPVIFLATRANPIWQKIPGLNKAAEASLESPAIKDRLTIWQLSLEAFKERPLIGWGFANFRIPYNKHYNPIVYTTYVNGTFYDKPHNVFIERLVDSGVLGLLAYILVFVLSFYTLRQPGNDEDDFLKPFLVSLLIAYLIQNFFIFDTTTTYMLWALVLAFIASRGRADGEPISAAQPLYSFKASIAFMFLAALLVLPLLYLNYEIAVGSEYEYDGTNYLLNFLPETSLVAFSAGLDTATPYIDDIRKNFAGTVMQAEEQGLQYPNISDLQAKLRSEMQAVIQRNPEEFYNYLLLAQFEINFRNFNSSYVNEAEVLANKALELSPNRQQTYLFLAKIKTIRGDISGAFATLDKVIALNPIAGDPHFYYGLLAYGTGDVKKGAAEIAKAGSLGRYVQRPEEAIALGNFIGDYEHDYAKAISYYSEALTMSNKIEQPNVLLKLALAYYYNHDFDTSRKTFLELASKIDMTKLPIYEKLIPILKQVKVIK